jgi:hypothetical protein
MRTPRRRRIWLALSGLYLLLLAATVPFYLLDSEMSADDKVLGTVGVAGIPAVAFVVATAPLLRGSTNRGVLLAGAVLAAIAAFFQLMLTFGFSFPLSIVLLVLAGVDANRGLRLSGVGVGVRMVALGAALAIFLGSPILSLALASCAVAMCIWKLISPRPRPPAAPDGGQSR